MTNNRPTLVHPTEKINDPIRDDICGVERDLYIWRAYWLAIWKRGIDRYIAHAFYQDFGIKLSITSDY